MRPFSSARKSELTASCCLGEVTRFFLPSRDLNISFTDRCRFRCVGGQSSASLKADSDADSSRGIFPESQFTEFKSAPHQPPVHSLAPAQFTVSALARLRTASGARSARSHATWRSGQGATLTRRGQNVSVTLKKCVISTAPKDTKSQF